MNRRNFIKSLAIGLLGLNLKPIVLFTEPVEIGAVGEFKFYMYWTMRMYVDNPRSCGILTNIGEE